MTANEVWRKSSRSNDNLNCVELSNRGGGIRDSKNEETRLPVSELARRAFLWDVRAGRFDR